MGEKHFNISIASVRSRGGSLIKNIIIKIFLHNLDSFNLELECYSIISSPKVSLNTIVSNKYDSITALKQ
jgi:hypothetical protein